VAVSLITVVMKQSRGTYFGWYGRLDLCRYKIISMLYGPLVY